VPHPSCPQPNQSRFLAREGSCTLRTTTNGAVGSCADRVTAARRPLGRASGGWINGDDACATARRPSNTRDHREQSDRPLRRQRGEAIVRSGSPNRLGSAHGTGTAGSWNASHLLVGEVGLENRLRPPTIPVLGR
jgi:hypothetical protein